MESPYHWNENVFVGLDYCIAEAGKRGMRCIQSGSLTRSGVYAAE